MKNLLSVLPKKVLRYSICAVLAYAVEFTINIFGLLDMFKVDNIPPLGIFQCSVLASVALIIMFVVAWFIQQPNTIYLAIKKNAILFQFGGMIVEVVALYKAYSHIQLMVMVNTVLWLLLIDYISLKYVDYNDAQAIAPNSSLYLEKPFDVNTRMTTSQREAYEQLVKLIDGKTSKASFNIGFIGAFGSGKSSVIKALVNNWAKRKAGPKYFVFKISALEINGVDNIINYTKRYFDDLFSKYEVSFINKAGFLSALAVMFEIKQPVKISANLNSSNAYVNIDQERVVFANQVKSLLKVSGRKNIVIIVEDADRTDIKNEVLNFLYEFSEIEGIIGLITLDKSSDICIRPSVQGMTNDNGEFIGKSLVQPQYDKLDKFIHVRVRINDDKDISKNPGVTKLILEQYSNLNNRNEDAYVQIPQQYKNLSMFEHNVGSTVIKNSVGKNDYDILTDIFFMKLKKNEKSLGDYFGELAINYLYNTNEMLSRIKEIIIAEKNGTLTYDLKAFYAVYLNFEADNYFQWDWLNRIESIANNAWNYLNIVYNGALYLDKFGDKYIGIKSIGDIYLCYLNRANNNFNLENHFGDGIVNPYLCIVFNDHELSEAKMKIKNKNYTALAKQVYEVAKKARTLLLEVIPLRRFVDYIRQSENNYRFLKMQLREAELLNLNFLDYLIGEWQINDNEYEDIKARLKNDYKFDDSEMQWIPIRTTVDAILYTNYIHFFLKDIQLKEINTTRAYIFGDKYICISEEDRREPVCVTIDEGKVVEPCAAEYGEIIKYDDELWNRKVD
ncbi:KAP family P-loop domain-containing protein [Pseudobutyrivibrio sp. YE44]|uniref:P-loop NTPase fold protein n=1 Tax=Pseudobutyrivibrio sp. YE44 TaxID=1520802 RepID=UPI0008851BE3|nr:P-loop NTPase fold protein [Pseudobutyrivibrio sp. YE44]SDB54430.1 KAP family P-loop domain-containing protein [Pseudobutyrivibrio sp. YE44]